MEINKITNFFFEIASMRRIRRSHSQVIQAANDNISDHSFRVTVIGMILANLEECDCNKVIKMCLFHDLAEIRTGDANFINQQYCDLNDNEAIKDQMDGLPIKSETLQIIDEYNTRQSKESLVAKDADILDQMILQQEYFFNDDVNRKPWQNHSERSLKTNSAKELATQIRKTNPFEWLYQLAEHKTGRKVER